MTSEPKWVPPDAMVKRAHLAFLAKAKAWISKPRNASTANEMTKDLNEGIKAAIEASGLRECVEAPVRARSLIEKNAIEKELLDEKDCIPEDQALCEIDDTLAKVNGEVSLPTLTEDQQAYLDRLQEAGQYDPDAVIGGPDKVQEGSADH